MILVDTSAWVEYDRATGSRVDHRISELIAEDGPLIVTEPVMMEVLAGVSASRRAVTEFSTKTSNMRCETRSSGRRVCDSLTMATRGFFGRRRIPEELAQRIPPGQHLETGFPVLTAGPTQKIPTDGWSFTVEGLVGESRTWSWDEVHDLPGSRFEGDIHCVTTWSKLGVSFAGISVDTLLDLVDIDDTATHVMAYCYGGYTTNLPLADVRGGRAWIAWEYGGAPLPAEHGGPARLLVPHLYFWKSAKWIKGLRLLNHNEPGFWEQNGYHDYGDPWKEQRFRGD